MDDTYTEIDPFMNLSLPTPLDKATNLLLSQGDQQISNVNSLSVGAGANMMGADQNGLFLGGSNFNSAPFSVDMNGNLTATNFALNGNQIVAGSITATQIATGTITATQISGSYVYAGSISANQINAGTLNANYIYGGTLTLGGSGNGYGIINILNGSGTVGIIEYNSGILFIDDYLDYMAWADSSSNLHGFIQASSGGMAIVSFVTMYINATNNGSQDINVTADRNINFVTNNQDIAFNAHNKLYFNSGNGYSIDLNSSGNINLNPSGTSYISAGRDIGMNNHNINGIGTAYGVNLSFSGSKSAVLDTSQGWIKVFSSEAPEVWFFDFCDSDDESKVDPLFLEVTEGDFKFIPCSDGTFQVWRRRIGFADQRFPTTDPPPQSTDDSTVEVIVNKTAGVANSALSETIHIPAVPDLSIIKTLFPTEDN